MRAVPQAGLPATPFKGRRDGPSARLPVLSRSKPDAQEKTFWCSDGPAARVRACGRLGRRACGNARPPVFPPAGWPGDRGRRFRLSGFPLIR
jgi:hypothetical protein